MRYVVFDLEATCWEERIVRYDQMETIEIGAVLVNADFEVVSCFSEFIKPLKHPKLSAFCKNLTKIDQEDVAAAAGFAEVVERFKEWFDAGKSDYALCSWGKYDRKQLASDCALHRLDAEWVDAHVNLRKQYAKFMMLKRAIGMERALIEEGFQLEGEHHRGIDDAKNIAKIFIKYRDKWNFDFAKNG